MNDCSRSQAVTYTVKVVIFDKRWKTNSYYWRWIGSDMWSVWQCHFWWPSLTFIASRGKKYSIVRFVHTVSEWAVSQWHISTLEAIQCHDLQGHSPIASLLNEIYRPYLARFLLTGSVAWSLDDCLKPNSITLAGSELVRSQIPSRYLVRTISEPASLMAFGREPASSC